MNKAVSRVEAKTAVIVDLVVSSIVLSFHLFAFLELILVWNGFIDDTEELRIPAGIDETSDENGIIIVSIMIGIPILLHIVQLWATCKLLIFSNTEKTTIYSLRKARYWKNVVIISLVISGIYNISLIITWGYPGGINIIIGLVVSILWRGLCLFVVLKYFNEQGLIADGELDDVQDVSVKNCL